MPTVENQAITVPATGLTRTISSFAVGNNPNRVLYAVMASYSASEPHETHDSVVFNTSEGFSKLDEQLQGNDDFRLSLWRLIAPSVATANIVATASGSISQALAVVSVYSAHQTTPNQTPAKNTALTGDPTTITFNSDVGELGLNASLSEYGVSTHGADQVEVVLDNTGWGFTITRKSGASPTLTMTENLTGAGASWVTLGWSVKPAASAISGPFPVFRPDLP